jgi:hypothetical protein
MVNEEDITTMNDGSLGLKINGWALFYLVAGLLYLFFAYTELTGKNIKDFLPTPAPVASTSEQPVIEGSTVKE